MPKDWTGNSASVFKTLGASNHTDNERQREDYYATEPRATELLCQLVTFDGPILEPSCGEGHISEELKKACLPMLCTLRPMTTLSRCSQ